MLHYILSSFSHHTKFTEKSEMSPIDCLKVGNMITIKILERIIRLYSVIRGSTPLCVLQIYIKDLYSYISIYLYIRLYYTYLFAYKTILTPQCFDRISLYHKYFNPYCYYKFVVTGVYHCGLHFLACYLYAHIRQTLQEAY